MANCFVNASYDPSRNGTCPSKVCSRPPCAGCPPWRLPLSLCTTCMCMYENFVVVRYVMYVNACPHSWHKVAEFRDLGFERENALREFVLPYPF